MFTLFGVLALTLAVTGLYAGLAFDTAQRIRELGVRRVLGAGKTTLFGNVAIAGARLTGVGLVLGLAVAYTASPYLNDLLFEVSPRDPSVFVGVLLLLTAAAISGALLPGLRATNVDARVALTAG